LEKQTRVEITPLVQPHRRRVFFGRKAQNFAAKRSLSGRSGIFVLCCNYFMLKFKPMKWDVIIIRFSFVAVLAAVGYLLNPLANTSHLNPLEPGQRQLISAVLGVLFAGFIIAFEMRARQASLRTLIGAAIGSILGIVGAYLIGMLITAQDINTLGGMRTFLTIVLACFMGYVGLMVGAAKGDYLDLSALGGIFSDKNVKRDYKILDTSVIIDGRIADVAETGFVGGTLIIPNFILAELQQVADSADSSKRPARTTRARHAPAPSQQQQTRHPDRRNRFSRCEGSRFEVDRAWQTARRRHRDERFQSE
jgi:hypothetical protein